MTSHSVRPAVPSDTPTLVSLGFASNLFTSDEAEALLGDSLRSLFAMPATNPVDKIARVVDGADGLPVGWSFLSADTAAEGVWELLWIGVALCVQGSGVGAALLADAEVQSRAAGARILIISTASTASTARARAFYVRNGYQESGRIANFYAEGDDKVIFVKQLK